MTAKLATLAKRLTLAALFCWLPDVAPAHDLTLDECLEGSDFILHAAMSRENGITREAFLERMESDIHAIQAFPPELRWFVQDQEDEDLLTAAARVVFDSPREAQRHRSEFLAACTARVGSSDARAGLPAMSPAVAAKNDWSDR
jgi:hypothetical protein